MRLIEEIAARVGWNEREIRVFELLYTRPGPGIYKKAGERLGLSGQRVSQIHFHAMTKLFPEAWAEIDSIREEQQKKIDALREKAGVKDGEFYNPPEELLGDPVDKMPPP